MTTFTAPPDDARPPTAQRPGAAAPDNLLRQYATVLRRRVWWVAVAVVIGLAAGYVSTLVFKAHTSSTRYYKATNTVVVGGGPATSDTGTVTSLNELGLLVESQTLTEQVAKALKVTPLEVSQQLGANVRPDGTALNITAVSTDPEQAVAMANAAASVLGQTASATAQQQIQTERASISKKLSSVQAQISSVQTQLADDPPNADALNDQLATLTSQQSALTTSLQQLTGEAADAGPTVTSLRPATPIRIDQQGYDWRRSQNINAASQLPTAANRNGPSFDETDFSTPTLASKRTRLAIGGAAGLVLGIIGAFVVEAWDDRLRSRTRAEAATGLPVLVEVPRLGARQRRRPSVAMVDAPLSPLAERYRSARASIIFALEAALAERPEGTSPGGGATPEPAVAGLAERPDATLTHGQRGMVLLVTSPSMGEGKSTTVANLAAACADAGLRTLVIDGDIHRPTAANYLRPEPVDTNPAVPAPTRISRVWYGAGPQGFTSPGEAVAALQRTITRLRPHFDMVLVDTPPMLATNDATDLLPAVDAVALVLRIGQTRLGAAERAAEMLGRLHANVLGLVLNCCDRLEMHQYYGYGYSYGYATGSTAPRGRGNEERRDARADHRSDRRPASRAGRFDDDEPAAMDAGGPVDDPLDADDLAVPSDQPDHDDLDGPAVRDVDLDDAPVAAPHDADELPFESQGSLAFDDAGELTAPGAPADPDFLDDADDPDDPLDARYPRTSRPPRNLGYLDDLDLDDPDDLDDLDLGGVGYRARYRDDATDTPAPFPAPDRRPPGA